VNITNNGSPTGILVSGTHQQVGNTIGTGTTQINPGSDLTANRIIQSALLIGGTATSHGLATIAASDASGNPVGASALAGGAGYPSGPPAGRPPDGGTPTDSGLGTRGLGVGAGEVFVPLAFAGDVPISVSAVEPAVKGSALQDHLDSINDLTQTANAAQVPEPSSLLLLALALGVGMGAKEACMARCRH
jgi:hypothetical protein